MGIDIYAKWTGQTDKASAAQSEAWLSTGAGGAGYLREAYHGTPYATKFLVAEAFENGEARIPAAVLQGRLPDTLVLVEERARKLYNATDEEVAAEKRSFREFVSLCVRKEHETGEPVLVAASY
jgi:hypothetical protein